MKKKIVVGVTLVLLTLAPLVAGTLTLEDALNAAKANNGSVKVATLVLEQNTRKTEVNAYLPSLAINLGAKATGSISDKTVSGTYTVGGISFSFNTTSLTTGETQRLSRLSANATYMSSLNTVTANVTTAYWNAVAATLNITKAQATRDQSARDLETAKAKYEGGKATTLSVQQAEVTLKSDEYALNVAKQTAETARTTLADLMGVDVEKWTFQDLPSQKTLKGLDELYRLVPATTAIQKLSVSVEQAKVTEKNNSNSYVVPSVSVTASTGLSGNLFSYKDGTTTGATIHDSTTLGVTVSIPLDHLIKSSQASVNIDTGKIATQIAQQNYANGITDLQASVRKAWVAVAQAKENITLLSEKKTLAEEQLKLSQASWEEGMLSYGDLENVKNDLTSAEISLLQQQLNYTIALYDLSAYLETAIDTLCV